MSNISEARIQMVDLVSSREADIWLDRFYSLIDRIADHSADRLKLNYIHLKENYRAYACFNLLLLDEEIIAFSAMQLYPQNWARVLTRLYYVNSVRNKSLNGHSFPSYATKYMLPYQINLAKQLNQSGVFLSMQGCAREKYLASLAKNINAYYRHHWKLLEGKYNTCRKLPNGGKNLEPSCWQSVIAFSLQTNYLFPLDKLDNSL